MIRNYRCSLIAPVLAVVLSFCKAPGACHEATPGQMTAPSDALQMVEAVKEPLSALAQIIREAAERLQGCPTDEASWYELIRAAEMRTEISPAWQFPPCTVSGKKLSSLAEAAAEAIRRVPESPRIALIDIRAWPDTARAAAFTAHFPGFEPLRLALAQAQLKAGNANEAAKSLESIHGLKAIPGAIGTLAAIRLAQGNPKAALTALTNSDTSSLMTRTAGSEAYERTPRIPRERAEIGFRAQLQLHHHGAALRPLLDAAALGSQQAQTILKKPDPDLAKAIAAARRSGNLNAIDQSYLGE
jgi:hypothetical protein